MELTETKFKQTELGLIPEDWEIKTLKDVGEVKMCRRIFSYQTKEQGDVPFYKIGTFGKKPDAFITKELYDLYRGKFSFPKVGDILISASGTIGRTVIYTGEDAYFQDSNIIWIDNNGKSISNDYLKYIYEVVKYRTEGGTIQRLYNNIIYDTSIICPPLPEQKAIVQVLCDTDNLIKAIAQKLTKKRAIKQGAMRQLLTPKGDWEMKTLRDLIEILADYTANGSFESLKNNVQYYSNINYAVLVRTTDLGKNIFEPKRFTDKQGFNFLSKTSLKGGELILANVGSIGKVFRVPFYNMPMTLAPNTYMIKFYKNYSQDFIYQWMLTNEFKNKLLSKVGSTTLLAINKDNLRDIEISVPKSSDEQTQIATILSDMDAEIAQLEKKLSKYKMLKQGLMQNLLTGKIRLV